VFGFLYVDGHVRAYQSCWDRSGVLRSSLTEGAGVPNCFAS
jgi:hypothetical protein